MTGFISGSFLLPTAAWIIDATEGDIPPDFCPWKELMSASAWAVSAEAVASFCLQLMASAVWAFAASLAAISARIELWSSLWGSFDLMVKVACQR